MAATRSATSVRWTRVDARRAAAAARLAVELGGHALGPTLDDLVEDVDLVEALGGERQPRPQLRIEGALLGQVDGKVQQRAGRRQVNRVGADRRHHLPDLLGQRLEVRAPEVAAVHDAERERQPVGTGVEHGVELAGPPHQVDVEHVDGQGGGERRSTGRGARSRWRA